MEAQDQANPKLRQILDGARARFLELGYEGVSMDAIGRRAGVSKATLYNYFADKRALFAAVVDRECQAQAEKIFVLGVTEGPTESALRAIARHYLEFLLSPVALNLFRIVVAECPRFPRLGRTFWESGPDLGTRRLAQFLAIAVGRGDLEIDNLELAANQFTELCKADLFYRCLLGVAETPSEPVRGHYADAAVDTFVRAYGARAASSG